MDNKPKTFAFINVNELMKQESLPCPENQPPLTIDEIIHIDPRIGEILNNIIVNTRSPKRYRLYSEIKGQLSDLVGWSAEKYELRTSQVYDVVMDIIIAKFNIA